MAKFRGPPICILEGSWWGSHEVPKILPFFQALATSLGPADLSHRTVRTADDIGYWISKINKGAHSLVYIACHGEQGALYPTGKNSKISRQKLLDQLRRAKKGSIDFLHLGCCEMVDRDNRAKSLLELANACGARWVSGYVDEVDWLRSTLLDLSVAAELFMPFHHDSKGRVGKGRAPHLATRAKNFAKDYEQLARALGFSGLAKNKANGTALIPKRLHTNK
jgi:hypothetical protein